MRDQLIWLVLGCAAGGVLYAQTVSATLEGSVRDPSDAAVPKAKVIISNMRTGVSRDLPTDVQGGFVVPYLEPGYYTVTVEKVGFKEFRQSDIKLDVQQVLSLDIKLQIGSVGTTVQVEGTPPPLATSSSTVATAIQSQSVIDLPLNGRDVLGLSVLVPGVAPGQGTAGDSPDRAPWISGGMNSTSEIRLDGGALGVPGAAPGVLAPGGPTPSPDAIQEIVVLTNSLAAEYGRTGGGVILVASKQGTNTLHGTGYWFLRNSKLDSNDFFSNRAGIPLTSLQENQAGGTLGGPVYVPKLYNGRNRTFFFLDYENTRNRTPNNEDTTVPLEQWKTGDFSNLRNTQGQAITIYDPLTAQPNGTGNYIRQAFPGNVIPASRINSVAASLMQYYPAPNTPSVNALTPVDNFYTAGTQKVNSYLLTVRGDHNFTNSWRTFLRVTRKISETLMPNYFDNPGTPGGRGNTNTTFHSISWDHTVILSPTTIFNANFALARSTQLEYPFSKGFDPTTLGFPAYLAEQGAKLYDRFPTFTVTGLSGLGAQTGAGLGQGFTSYNAMYSITKVWVNHTVKAGGEYRVLPLDTWTEGTPTGSFSFNTGWTQQNPVQSVATQGFGLASLLLGLPASGSESINNAPAVESTYWAAYVQDDFRVTRNLTLNLGVRYEVDIPRTERYNHMSYFDLSAPSPIAGQVPGFPDLVGAMEFTNPNHRSQTPMDTNNVSPRFGFAYKIGSKTVARGGYTLMYAPSIMQAASSDSGFEGYDSSTSMIVSLDGRTPLNYLSNPFPAGFNSALGSTPGPTSGPSTDLGLAVGQSWFPTYVNPVIQQWNFNLQRVLPGHISAEVGYLGSKGNHIIDGETSAYDQLPSSDFAMGNSLNNLVPNPFYGIITNPTSTLSMPTVTRGQLLRPYPQYTGMNSTYRPDGNYIYDAFTLRADKRFSNGLGFLLSFTGAKSIDDSTSGGTLDAQNGVTARQDVYDRKADRAVSLDDVARRFVASFTYELPFGRGRNFLRSAGMPVELLLGGWHVNGIVTLQSGLPVPIYQSTNNTGLSTEAQRPNNDGHSAKITGGTETQRLAEWFNPSVFSIAPAFTFGDAPRVLPDVRDPGLRNCDLSLFKNFPVVKERLQAEFRLEAFNALNTPQFGRAGSTVGTPSLGVISGVAVNPRQVQLALKFIF